ncbi:hypothetical protein TNCV_2925671 [Trichonephila clavipes]|nr:hypothetical protein TNCV_2925671 [Trichonephila clavipes]
MLAATDASKDPLYPELARLVSNQEIPESRKDLTSLLADVDMWSGVIEDVVGGNPENVATVQKKWTTKYSTLVNEYATHTNGSFFETPQNVTHSFLLTIFSSTGISQKGTLDGDMKKRISLI